MTFFDTMISEVSIILSQLSEITGLTPIVLICAFALLVLLFIFGLIIFIAFKRIRKMLKDVNQRLIVLGQKSEQPSLEPNLAKISRYKKIFGRKHKNHLQFLVRAQSGLYHMEDDVPVHDIRDLEKHGDAEGLAAVTLLTSLRDDYANGRQIRKAAGLLSRALDWDPHPVLDELALVDPELGTRFVLNFRLSFSDEHIRRFATATEDEAWCDMVRPECGPGGVGVVRDGCWVCVDMATCEMIDGGG